MPATKPKLFTRLAAAVAATLALTRPGSATSARSLRRVMVKRAAVFSTSQESP